MKNFIFIMAGFLCLYLNDETLAQNSQLHQTIRGTVIDHDTQIPIIGANVVVVDSDPFLGASTDVNGNFKIEKAPVGRHTLTISFLGYESQSLPNVLLGVGKELVINIELIESVVEMNEIVVKATQNKAQVLNEMATVSAQSFSVEETKRYAASVSDPARMVSAFAGVSSNGGDDQNAIIIRGNSPRGLLWRMEGVEIPNPNHFASEGASSGGISILSANVLSKSDFYTGAFPSEFGNALSGVFDLKLRNGNNEKNEYTLQAGILGMEAAAEGPLKKGSGASFLVNYRYSTLALLNDLGVGIVGDEDVTTYQDVSFKLHIPTQKMGTFSLWGIGGLSKNTYQPKDIDYSDVEKANMGAMGLSHLAILGDKTYLKTTLSLSATSIGEDEEDNEGTYQGTYKEQFNKTYARASMRFNTKLNRQHIVESGLTYTALGYNFLESFQFPSIEPPFNNFERFNEKGNASTLQAYTSWKFRLTESLSWVNGVHFLRFGLNESTAVEPRSALKWQLQPNQSLSFGFGIHSKVESLEYYLANQLLEDGTKLQPNRNLDFSKAQHYVLGYDVSVNNQWYFKTEAYFQRLYNLPISSVVGSIFSPILLEEGFSTQDLMNEGTGRNYGLEFTAQRFFSKGFYLLTTASLYEAKFTALDGKERNTPFNGNFNFNVLSGKEFKVGKRKQNLIGVNMRGTWGGNSRFIPIDLEHSRQNGETVRNIDGAYEERYPDFMKFDLQLSYRKNKRSKTTEWRLDLLNALNRENIWGDYYNVNSQTIEYDYQTGLIPVLSYRVEF
ncbi:MAG: TonB-dependent receptor [Chitinophagales bacterium]